MDLSAEILLRPLAIGIVTIDRSLRILAFSGDAPRMAEDPGTLTEGTDLRVPFPEFVGLEPDLQRLLDGSLPFYTIGALGRAHAPGLYVRETVKPGPAHEGIPCLTITIEDISTWMQELQKRIQSSNDALLLMEAMTASKEYVENILNAMADMLLVTSTDSIITAVNRATLALTGYTSPELIGRPITLLIPTGFATEGPEALSAAREVTCSTKDGSSIPVSFSRAPLVAGAGIVHGTVYLGRDLREQYKARERIVDLETHNLSLQEVLKTAQGEPEIVCSSPAMRSVMENVGKVAQTDATVMISGETGTGKELVARAIHRLSSRKEELLVTVNCAALPAGLVESELFGHEKGAFTGALQRRIGRFELANGGTVFLDEVGELPLSTQATLLRVLQEHEFERVGGTQTVRINVRVIAATNRDLQREVSEGRFREDLLFRLNVFPLVVPPLRERREDILPLTRYFMQAFAKRTNRQPSELSPAAEQKLLRYRWPGNIRELANVIERALIVCRGTTLDLDCLALTEISTENTGSSETFDEMARQHLLRTLEQCAGVIEGPQGAAAKLGLKPATLRSRLKKLGITRRGSEFVVQG